MKWLVFISLYFTPLFLNAQDCESLISSNGMDEYYQSDKSKGRLFHKPVTAELWADRIGQLVYLNITLKDTIANVTLRKNHGKYVIQFNFYNNKQVAYYYKDTSLNSIISIPINKDPDEETKIILRENDSGRAIQSYTQFLEIIYKNPLSYISINMLNPKYPAEGALYSESHSLSIRKEEAEKLQQAIICIFKAIQ